MYSVVDSKNRGGGSGGSGGGGCDGGAAQNQARFASGDHEFQEISSQNTAAQHCSIYTDDRPPPSLAELTRQHQEQEQKAQQEQAESIQAVKRVPDFIASQTWVGRKPGMVFKRGEKGQGYYKDETLLSGVRRS